MNSPCGCLCVRNAVCVENVLTPFSACACVCV